MDEYMYQNIVTMEMTTTFEMFQNIRFHVGKWIQTNMTWNLEEKKHNAFHVLSPKLINDNIP